MDVNAQVFSAQELWMPLSIFSYDKNKRDTLILKLQIKITFSDHNPTK